MKSIIYYTPTKAEIENDDPTISIKIPEDTLLPVGTIVTRANRNCSYVIQSVVYDVDRNELTHYAI